MTNETFNQAKEYLQQIKDLKSIKELNTVKYESLKENKIVVEYKDFKNAKGIRLEENINNLKKYQDKILESYITELNKKMEALWVIILFTF